MSYKIKSMSKAQLGRICQGAQDANARLEAQQSREFSMSVIALCFVCLCICGLWALFDWLLWFVGVYAWWVTALCFIVFSILVSVFLILPAMRNAKLQRDKDIEIFDKIVTEQIKKYRQKDGE